MTLEQFRLKIQEETGFPFCIVAFKKGVVAPFGAILDNSETISSDSRNHGIKHDITVEFYSETAAENIDRFFNSNNLPFTKSLNYIISERLFMTIYNLQNAIIEKQEG